MNITLKQTQEALATLDKHIDNGPHIDGDDDCFDSCCELMLQLALNKIIERDQKLVRSETCSLTQRLVDQAVDNFLRYGHARERLMEGKMTVNQLREDMAKDETGDLSSDSRRDDYDAMRTKLVSDGRRDEYSGDVRRNDYSSTVVGWLSASHIGSMFLIPIRDSNHNRSVYIQSIRHRADHLTEINWVDAQGMRVAGSLFDSSATMDKVLENIK